MPNDEILTDDYVAGLLSKEANDCSLKYSAMGMEAYRDKKPANMMRPNKRFLRHIIKDTDTHNRNLLAKEAAESRARLKDLEHAEETKRLKTNPNTRDIRKRQMGDIHAILGGKRRRQEGEAPSREQDNKRREPDLLSEKNKDLTRRRHDDRKQHGRLLRTDGRLNKTKEGSRRDERRESRRSRSRGSENEESRHHSHKSRHRSASPRRRRSHSPRERKSKHRHRSPIASSKTLSKQATNDPDDSSDPLDDFIGPAPPPRYRGRGALGSSGIDRRFSESYDPRNDVEMDQGETAGVNNWDDTVEAFRDRQKLKQNQEQRLRAAGFADEEIERANSSKEKAGEDVQWTKAGEKREWDRGKGIESGATLFSEDI